MSDYTIRGILHRQESPDICFNKSKRNLALLLKAIFIFLFHPLKKGITAFALLAFSSICFSQQPTVIFRHVTIRNGLSNNTVLAMVRDQNGHLWIGSQDGLNRFDGYSSLVYRPGDTISHSLTGNAPHAFYMAGAKIFIGTQAGLSVYDPSSGSFSGHYLLKNPSSGAPVPSYVYPFHIDDRQRYWAYTGYNGSVSCYNAATGAFYPLSKVSDGRVFTPSLPGQPLNVYATPLGRGVRIVFLNDGKIRRSTNYFAGENGEPAIRVVRCLFTNDSTAWMTSDAGLIMLNINSGSYRIYSEVTLTTGIAEAGKDHFWIGTSSDGLFLFDRKKNAYTGHYTHDPNDPESIGANSITDVYSDAAGTIFVALKNKGISYGTPAAVKFQRFLNNEDVEAYGKINQVTAIVTDHKSRLWAGTNGSGIFEYDFSGKMLAHLPLPGNTGTVRMLCFGNDSLVGVSPEGFFAGRIEDRSLKRLSEAGEQLLPDLQQIIYGGAFYALTERGMFHMRIWGDRLTLIPVESVNNTLKYSFISSGCFTPDGKLLIKTQYTSLFVFLRQPGGFGLISSFRDQNYNVNSYAPQPDGSVWMATTNGLLVLDAGAGQLQKPAEMSIQDQVMHVFTDEKGNRWYASANGMHFYNGEKKTWKKYTYADGLQSNEFVAAACVTINDTLFAAGGNNGFNLVTPRRIVPRSYVVPLTIRSLLVNGKRMARSETAALREIRLPYGKHSVELQLSAIDFNGPERVEVYYRLTGENDTEILLPGDATIRLSGLEPGTHMLTIGVRNADGYDLGIMHTVMIYIAFPYWQSVWFYISLIVAVIVVTGMIVYGFMLYRKLQERKNLRLVIASQENERSRIAADLHDDLGARLSTIKLYLNKLKREQPEIVKNPAFSQSIEIVDSSIGEIRGILLSLSPRTLEENGFLYAVEALAGKISESGLVNVALFLSGLKPEHRFERDLEISMYRIIQELINNTLKHAAATEITISIRYHDDMLAVTYEDNGSGFRPEDGVKGSGTRNIKMRVSLLKGNVHLDSHPGRGMTAHIEIPV